MAKTKQNNLSDDKVLVANVVKLDTDNVAHKVESKQGTQASTKDSVDSVASVSDVETNNTNNVGDKRETQDSAESGASVATTDNNSNANKADIKQDALDSLDVAASVVNADANSRSDIKIDKSKNLLEINNLKKYFTIKADILGRPIMQLRAVDDVSLYLEQGQTLGIVGESGCGKTTMGRSILKLHEISGGQIIFDGADITNLPASRMRKLRTQMQIIFQDPYSSLPPRMSVGNIIAEAVKVHKLVPSDEVKAHVLDVMHKCGLQSHYYDRYPHEFSGGQRQRICIARALAVNPKLVVCDEPVSALDVSIQAQIINLLQDLKKEFGLSYLFISHDLSVVSHISDRICVMYLGSIMEVGSRDSIFDSTTHPYTKTLLSAVPVPDPRLNKGRIIPKGDLPSPVNPPKGCKFCTRCQYVKSVCVDVRPTLKQVGEGHWVACHFAEHFVK